MKKSVSEPTLKPIISVLMPAFNVEKYIAVAIESVLNQSFANFEFIVLDDGSSDDTAKIIDTYLDLRMKKVFLSENKGLVSARNTLVGMAQGK
jgi:glycosyltransferase involved in cell wall biosynthesis